MAFAAVLAVFGVFAVGEIDAHADVCKCKPPFCVGVSECENPVGSDWMECRQTSLGPCMNSGDDTMSCETSETVHCGVAYRNSELGYCSSEPGNPPCNTLAEWDCGAFEATPSSNGCWGEGPM